MIRSERYDLMHQCGLKQQYPGFGSALFGCHAIISKESRDGGQHAFTIYVCPYCGAYHVGRVPTADTPATRDRLNTYHNV